MKSFVTEMKKLVKLWWWNFSIFHCISHIENVVFRQNEGFLVKTKHRFGFSDQKYISWVRGSRPDVGSLEFGYFWWTSNIRLFFEKNAVGGYWFWWICVIIEWNYHVSTPLALYGPQNKRKLTFLFRQNFCNFHEICHI